MSGRLLGRTKSWAVRNAWPPVERVRVKAVRRTEEKLILAGGGKGLQVATLNVAAGAMPAQRESDECCGATAFEVCVEHNVPWLRLSNPQRRHDATLFLSEVFSAIAKHGIGSTHVVQATVSSCTFAMPASACEPEEGHKLAALVEHLKGTLGATVDHGAAGSALLECRVTEEKSRKVLEAKLFDIFSDAELSCHIVTRHKDKVAVVLPSSCVDLALDHIRSIDQDL